MLNEDNPRPMPCRQLDLHQEKAISPGGLRPALTQLFHPVLFTWKVMNIKVFGHFLLETA